MTTGITTSVTDMVQVAHCLNHVPGSDQKYRHLGYHYIFCPV